MSFHPRSGRPIKEWGDLCERSKRAKIADLANEHHVALSLAASKSAKSAEENDSAYILKRTSKCVDVAQMRRSIDSLTPTTMKLEEALALKTQTDLSDSQYQMLRNSALSHNVKIYPSLNKLGEEKLKCYPEGIQFNEMSAKCSLQSMLNHTVTRIIDMIDLKESCKVEMNGILYVKIGFDGASSQSIYKQKFDSLNFTEESKQEDSLFSTAIVPLLFKVENIDFWKNSKSSSCHFCRPLHLQYKKETSELCKEEEADLQTQMNQLKPFSTDLNIAGAVITIKVTFKIDMTMFDGKVINSLTDTKSTQSCNVCGCKPKEMNDIDLVKKKPVNEKALKLGISNLHCWIRSFEFILHLGYKMEIQKFQARTEKEKLTVNLKKNFIKSKFREKLSLIVDQPKVGFGNSNDGNTSRRAFENSAIFSEITGVDMEVIKRMHIVLITISSGYHIDSNQFEVYCTDTAKIIVNKYGWYIMPPSVHKILIHGCSISKQFDLPIAQYSEEAQESLNKQIRNVRLHHTTKISRINTMKDQMHYLLIRSDPKISSISFVKHRSYQGRTLPPEVVNLLVI